MRLVEEGKLWSKLTESPSESLPLELSWDGHAIALNSRCTIVAGLNGAGKSRFLLEAKAQLGESATLIRLHEDCERTLEVLRSRSDIDELEDETGNTAVEGDEFAWLKRVIGRDYQTVTRSELELIPSDGGGEFVVPNFRVAIGLDHYATLDMGLGELSIHLLFWQLSRLDQQPPGSFVILDEPDAYLPPQSRVALLRYLLDFALRGRLNLLIASHSEALIEEALENGCLTLLTRDVSGTHSFSVPKGRRDLAKPLLSPRQFRVLMLVEDEVAAALLRALLGQTGRDPSGWHVTWLRGESDLRELAARLPSEAGLPFGVVIVFDGDIDCAGVKGSWPVLALPGEASPDALLRTLSSEPEKLADALRLEKDKVHLALAALEGRDDHDWVNELCAVAGRRAQAMTALAELWVTMNPDDTGTFATGLESALGGKTWA